VDLKRRYIVPVAVRPFPAENDSAHGGAPLPRDSDYNLLKMVQTVDPHAFITIDPVSRAIGGYLPVSHPPAAGIRK
jgi:hypothetical protein